ncbi:MAG: hypothetical protein F2663_04605 [Actinobacteria bacterium]|uniref:Unannotated protein n=1 Tax=freshwater metagenome TaxID=449393 RepID=A0A6J6P536_9ZZZZ|nr:hypothetical protein [Actinomycetota bacterium]
MSLVIANDRGSVTFAGDVLDAIAVRSAESVAGVKVRRRRSVDLADSRAKLSLEVARGDASLAEVGARVQLAVEDAFVAHLSRDVTVDIAIEELR